MRRGRCLVTGATGFIGGRLAQRLLDDSYEVRCLVRASSDTSHLDALGVQMAVGDLTDADTLAAAVADCRYVLHCGALVSDWATVAEITAANVHGTRNVLAASVGASVERFIHFSTTDVYGHPGSGTIDESYVPQGFANWYAQTKRQAEDEVRSVGDQSPLETVILRPATVYGPGSKEVVGEIARAIAGGHMLLVGRGQTVAGLCYIDNLLDAASLALEHPHAPGHALNVTDGLAVTWRQFTDALARGLGCPGVRFSLPYWAANAIATALEHGYRLARRATGLHTAPLLSRQAVQVLGKDQDFSNTLLRETLGWAPRVDYPTGLDATLDWLTGEYLKRR